MPAYGGPEPTSEPDDLRAAIARGDLHVVYQPQVSLQSDRIVGVEALVRWEHPERGRIPPDRFIPIAEQHGLIGELGRWVLHEACVQLGSWRRAGPAFDRMRVAVNVSPLQLRPDLVEHVQTALAAGGLAPGHLCLEVTESALMRDLPAAVATLGALKTAGVHLAIDDFGVGYSSLAQLRWLQVDELKIDRSFVGRLDQSSEERAVVAAIVAMAHALGLTVVAEGVETEAQLAELRRLGCESAQGYLFARPLPAADIASIVAGPGPLVASHVSRSPAPRVLIVDDAEDVLMLASVSLTTGGFDVALARSGREAIDAVERLRPDLVVLDVMLPDLPGTEVCRHLRASGGGAGPRIVMLTARDDPLDKLEAYSCGADDYVVKPFSPRELVGRAWATLRRERERSSAS